MLVRELCKIGVCLVAGLILAGSVSGLGGAVYLLVPIYCLGLLYGISTIIPWIGRAMASLSKMFMMSVIMKNLFSVILLIVIIPVALVVLLTVGWIIGIVHLVQKLSSIIQQESIGGAQRSRFHRQWESSGGWGSGGNDGFDDWDALPGDTYEDRYGSSDYSRSYSDDDW